MSDVIPKITRLKDAQGKEVGSYRTTVNGKSVNLKTKDYMEARERAKAAHAGKTEFEKQRVLPQLGPMPTNGTTNGAPKSSDDWTVDLSNAAADGLKPDDVIPPEEWKPRPDVPPVSEDKSKPEEPKQASTSASTIGPDMLRGLIKQGAQVLVELQITGQEWMWRRWAKAEVAPIPPDHESRQAATQLWEQAIAEWIPPELPIPPWLLAPLVCAALTVPVQMQSAQPIQNPPKKPE
jgi:hypothetical protein